MRDGEGVRDGEGGTLGVGREGSVRDGEGGKCEGWGGREV